MSRILQKPLAISIYGQCVDAKESNKITWTISGDTSVAYQVSIYKTTDGSLAFTSGKVTSYAVSYTLPANSLVNGNTYRITVSAFDSSNNSQTSDYYIFQTSSRPVVTVPMIGTVASNSYNFSASYSQAENVLIRNWSAYLYDENQNKIGESGLTISANPTYYVTGLESNTTYYIEFQATSNLGLTGTSGLIQFTVSYSAPTINVGLGATNTDDCGIQLSWKAIQIIGHTDNTPIFINGEKLNLLNDRMYVNEGLTIADDFTIKIWFENVPSKKVLLFLDGPSGYYTLQYDLVLERFILQRYTNNGLACKWVSNEVFGYSYFVCIQQIGSFINLTAEVTTQSIDGQWIYYKNKYWSEYADLTWEEMSSQ